MPTECKFFPHISLNVDDEFNSVEVIKSRLLVICMRFFLRAGLPCFQTQTDIKELLENLGQNVVTKKRKNVEILWIAGTVSRVTYSRRAFSHAQANH